MLTVNQIERETAERRQAIQQEYRQYKRLLFWLVAVGFAVNIALLLRFNEARPGHALMEFTHAAPVGETALCPGDTLRYDVSLHVSGPGVFDLDVSVWRTTPPATVLFSSTRRMVFTGPTDYELERSWTIPDFYASSVDGSPERWAAGQYERRHAISTSSRSTQPSIVAIPFSVRADCP